MFNFYPTPETVVKIFKTHLPKSAASILDPAAGEGDLVRLIPSRYGKNATLTLVDIDKTKTDLLTKTFRNAKVFNKDFLVFTPKKLSNYDLILMNPPFSARSENWVNFNDVKMPIEAAISTLR